MNAVSPELDALLAAARAWRDQDPDDETRAELDLLLGYVESSTDVDTAAEAVADLHSRFDTRLAFGTAGLRGELAAGPNRMNRVVVAQAAAGFARYLLDRSGADRPTVVIGYDGRKNSAVFATDSAEILAGAGIDAVLLPRMLPTPVLAFAVRHLRADAGIMVTASHNPPRDNGYKVYLGGTDEGAQIVPPVDAEIAREIERAAEVSVLDLPRSDEYRAADESVIQAYVRATAPIAERFGRVRDADFPRVAYTALHGVGWPVLRDVLGAAGIPEPVLVSEQIEPHGSFPTVAYPNPEEPGALDLAYRTARECQADLIVANDPDADRLAVAVPDAAEESGYRRLTGNEIGLLLGWSVAERTAATGGSGTLACSIVSSPALGAVAQEYGLAFHETLTGFKWVSRAPDLVFGYEEALGYLVNPETVRDKDGISAAVAMLALAGDLRARGQTLEDRLAAFAERFGHHASGQVSVRVSDLGRIGEIMRRLRSEPPAELAGTRVNAVDDLLVGTPALPSSDVLRFHLADGSRVMIRPSGTEPKVKVYLDTSSESADGARAALARLEGAARELLAL